MTAERASSARQRATRTEAHRVRWLALLVGCCLSSWWAAGAAAGDLEEAETLYRTGRYDQCAAMAAEEMGNAGGAWTERWRQLEISAKLARGKYDEAMASLESALRRFPASISLRLLGLEVYRYNGRERDAASELEMIERLVVSAPHRYSTPEARVALGRFFLLKGADAKKVLDLFYDVALKQQPDLVEAYLASAELALEKQDYALAAQTLRKAPKSAGLDPQFHSLLARAYSEEDRAGAAKELTAALQINPHHVDSLLLQADDLVDRERYSEAEQVVKQVFAVNPHQPRGWAYLSVLAHLRNDGDAESSTRRSALEHWAANPEVDHLIGRKLSQKYRFAEGSAYQRKALELDPDYLPAKLQLCQDLLRLGDEADGWKLAADIFAKDAYNVVAYNLTTLRDRVAAFRTLEDDGLVVRMDPREADLYGREVLELLRQAKKVLCEKYGVAVPVPVIVEIFPQRKEFAVRTLGLPGADGFLGVCFGRVITANSPASQGASPSNWQAVLWHEFCHVVTLSKTRNKMPRWLSEGISVYEEGRKDPTWGQSLNPRYRAMILGSELTPLSRLSSAFLTPKTPLHLQFAYFESALAVDFFVQRFGLAAVKGVLEDLGAGTTINDALPRRTKMTLELLDREFAQFARQQAENLARGATWEEPDLPADADSAALSAWLEAHPQSFWGLKRLAARLVTEEKWEKAKEVLGRLKRLYPGYTGPENAYVLLAVVYRRLSDPAAERQALEELAALDGSASPAYLRLMALAEAAQDWRGVAANAHRLLAVNPLIPAPYRQLGRAAEELGQPEAAINAYRTLASLDDSDPAEVHYRLARLLHQTGQNEPAKREVLKALEEAPRFLDAHRLLLELVEPKPNQDRRGSRPPTPEARASR
jgi:tetratricopeptide (TPR) repeat protein